MVLVSDAIRWPVLSCPRVAGFEVSTEGLHGRPDFEVEIRCA